MRKSLFSEEQIVGILQEYAAGAKASELCRIDMDFSLPGERGAVMLNRLARERGHSDILVVEMGSNCEGVGWMPGPMTTTCNCISSTPVSRTRTPAQQPEIQNPGGVFRKRCPSTKRNGHRRLSYLRAPHLRPLLAPLNDGRQIEGKLDLRMTLKKRGRSVQASFNKLRDILQLLKCPYYAKEQVFCGSSACYTLKTV